MLQIGLIGTVIAALCCVTPVLVVLLGAVGLAGAVGWLDPILMPALAVFLGIALWRQRA